MNDMDRNDPCPVCGGIDVKDFGKPRIEPAIGRTSVHSMAESVRVLGCRTCRFYYCSPRVRFSREDLSLLYDDEYFGEASTWYLRCQRETVPKRNLDRLEVLCAHEIKDFFEIGFGQGYVLQAALRRGWNVSGVEASPTFVEDVRRRLGIDVALGELPELALAPESFDVVYANSVLEHALDPQALMGEVSRLLRPGGVAFLLVPNEDALVNDFRHLMFRLLGRATSSRLDPFRTPYHLQGSAVRA